MDAGRCRDLTCVHTNTYLSVLSARMRFSAHSLDSQNNKRNTSKNNEIEKHNWEVPKCALTEIYVSIHLINNKKAVPSLLIIRDVLLFIN